MSDNIEKAIHWSDSLEIPTTPANGRIIITTNFDTGVTQTINVGVTPAYQYILDTQFGLSATALFNMGCISSETANTTTIYGRVFKDGEYVTNKLVTAIFKQWVDDGINGDIAHSRVQTRISQTISTSVGDYSNEAVFQYYDTDVMLQSYGQMIYPTHTVDSSPTLTDFIRGATSSRFRTTGAIEIYTPTRAFVKSGSALSAVVSTQSDFSDVNNITGLTQYTFSTQKWATSTIIASAKNVLKEFYTGLDDYTVETEYPEYTPDIGVGDYDTTSDIIPIPSLPNGGLDDGFLNAYTLNSSQLANFSNSFFDVDFADTTKYWLKNSKPQDYLLGLCTIPYIELPSNSQNIKMGGFTLDCLGNQLTNRYIEFDCGTLNLKEHFGNFIDYQNTQMDIYLPYIGYRPLDIYAVMNCSISLKYHIDLLTTQCIAFLSVYRNQDGTVLQSVINSYVGKLGAEYPLNIEARTTLFDTIAKTSGVVANIVPSASTGIVSSVSNSIANMQTVNSDRIGSFGDGSGLMNIQTPHIIITRPISAMPPDYNDYIGISSSDTVDISTLTGYSELTNIRIEGADNTYLSSELTELQSILAQGVYFN